MNWKILQIKEQIFHSPSHPYFFSQQYPSPPRAPPNIESSGFSLNDEVSPSVLLIIIILAIIFFVSGLLHLLVRVLMRPSYRDPDDLENVTSLQGQLQQLFHLHDAGVDQSFIDTLPVFNYNAIIGCKNPLDCAVCLCEFEQEDKLRLLPKCSHAFHMACIDTWLLSHSTCPICRASLLPENNNCSPIVFVLESESESSREFVSNRETSHGNLTNSSAARTNSHLDFQGENELGSVPVNIPPKSCEIHVKSDGSSSHEVNEKVVSIKLEKFRSVDGGEYKETGLGILTNSSASRTNSHLGFRGDGEMGSIPINVSHKSCEVVVKADYSSSREVNERVVSIKLGKFRSVGEGESSSESNAVSRRCFSMGSFAYVMEENPSLQVPIKTGLDVNGGCISNRLNGRSVERSRRESFSVSKIWMRSKMENPNPTADSSRRAFSFRFRAPAANDEIQRSDLQGKVPSFARRTLRWLVGRQSKAVHSTSALNI